MGYTWRQFMAYRTLASQRYAASLRDQLTVQAAAMAGGKGAESLRQTLSAAAGDAPKGPRP